MELVLLAGEGPMSEGPVSMTSLGAPPPPPSPPAGAAEQGGRPRSPDTWDLHHLEPEPELSLPQTGGETEDADLQLMIQLLELRRCNRQCSDELDRLDGSLRCEGVYSVLLKAAEKRDATVRRLEGMDRAEPEWEPGMPWPEGDRAAAKVQTRWRGYYCRVYTVDTHIEHLVDRQMVAEKLQQAWRRRVQRGLDAPPGCSWWICWLPNEMRKRYRVIRTCDLTLRREIAGVPREQQAVVRQLQADDLLSAVRVDAVTARLRCDGGWVSLADSSGAEQLVLEDTESRDAAQDISHRLEKAALASQDAAVEIDEQLYAHLPSLQRIRHI
jgi:hypothetical protein